MPTVRIKGMSCQHCVASVTKALGDLDGITDVTVELEKGEASYTETKPVSADTIKQAIDKIGFEVV